MGFEFLLGLLPWHWNDLPGMPTDGLFDKISHLVVSLAATLIGAQVAFRYAETRRGVLAFLSYLFPLEVLTSRSFRIDLAITAFRVIIGTFVAFSAILIAAWTADGVRDVAFQAARDLHHILPKATMPPGWLAYAAICVIGMLVCDLGDFVTHVAHHRVPILWEFHKVHHAAEYLTPLTGKRFHPVQDQIDQIVIGMMAGIFIGIVSLFWRVDLIVMNAAILGTWYLFQRFAFDYLRHTHVALRLGPLEAILLSPAHHQLHHSAELRHQNINYGASVAFWDRLCGTLVTPEPPGSYRLGLPADETQHYVRLRDIYLRPLAQAAAMVRRTDPRPPDTAIEPVSR